MKRITAILLVLVLVISAFSVAAFAETPKEYKCYDRFIEYYDVKEPEVFLYDEIYCHYTDPADESSLDWVLLQAAFGEGDPSEYMEEIGGRIVCLENRSYPFVNSYGIYDVKEDKFFQLTRETASRYEDLKEVFSSIEFHSPVYEYGYDAFCSELKKLNADDQDPHYRVLSYRINEGSIVPAEGFGFQVEWALVEAYAEPSASVDLKPASFIIGNNRYTSREAVWPYRSKLALYIPSVQRFYSLSGLSQFAYYEGLEEAILKLDPDEFGFDVRETNFYLDRFKETFPFGYQWDRLHWPYYSEVYYHHDRNGETDWALIYTFNMVQVTWMVKTGCFIGNRAIYGISSNSVFESWYGIYDVKNDTFKALPSVADGEFADLEDVVEQLKIGVLIGDADQDGKITILDATRIQKILANIADDFDDTFYGKALDTSTAKYVSDYDRDGKRSVLDATHIQRHLVGLE